MAGTREGGVAPWLRTSTIAFFVFLLTLVVIADSGLAHRELLQVVLCVPGYDKTVHFVLMGTMALLLNLTWQGACWRLGPLPILKGSVLVAFVVTLEELSQRFMDYRNFSLEDLAYNYLGILLIGQLALVIPWWGRRRTTRPSAPAG